MEGMVESCWVLDSVFPPARQTKDEEELSKLTEDSGYTGVGPEQEC